MIKKIFKTVNGWLNALGKSPLSGFLSTRDYIQCNGFKDDAKNLNSDWVAVSNDFKKVIKQYERQSNKN